MRKPGWYPQLMTWQSRIRLNPKNHQYSVCLDGRTWTRVRGTTGVIPKGKQTVENLKVWAGNQVEAEAMRRLMEDWDGMSDPLPVLRGCADAHKWELDRLSNQGTQLHAIFECVFRRMLGQNVPEVMPENKHQEKVLEKFLQWIKDRRVEPIGVEVLLYNPILNHAGMADLIAFMDGAPKAEILDYKRKQVAKPVQFIYPEHKLQSVAYRLAHMTMLGLPESEMLGGRIVYYPREGTDLPIMDRPVVSDPLETGKAFGHCLGLYNWQLEEARRDRAQAKLEHDDDAEDAA